MLHVKTSAASYENELLGSSPSAHAHFPARGARESSSHSAVTRPPTAKSSWDLSISSRERKAMGNKYSIDNRVVGKGVPKKRTSAKGTKRTPPYVSLPLCPLECACLVLYQELIYHVCACVSMCEFRPSPVNRSPSAAAQGKENATPTQPPSTNI